MNGTSDILGHQAILSRLWAAVRRDGLHHAYLFEGPEGVGKRLVALRLAMACNCEHPDGAELPCGTCKACRSIAAGTHPDVIVIEPLADRATPIISVDQIREVVRQVGYHRFTGRRRVVIVDPAESMPAPAANALLKTLEEPPDGTGFVLIAGHASALLPTIVSRCQRVRFAAVPQGDLATWLAAQGHEDSEALARLSMGRPGAALALADGSLERRRALRSQVLNLVGSGDLDRMFEYSRTLCTGGRAQWRPKVEELFEVLEDLLRDATVSASGASVPLLDDERLADRAATRLYPGGIVQVSVALEQARTALALNATGRTVLDAVLVRLATELGTLG